MSLLRYTSRCGRWMRTVSRYGATTLTGRSCGPLMTPALWDDRVERAQPVHLVSDRPRLVQVGQVSGDG
jgi:hypothetical protein